MESSAWAAEATHTTWSRARSAMATRRRLYASSRKPCAHPKHGQLALLSAVPAEVLVARPLGGVSGSESVQVAAQGASEVVRRHHAPDGAVHRQPRGAIHGTLEGCSCRGSAATSSIEMKVTRRMVLRKVRAEAQDLPVVDLRQAPRHAQARLRLTGCLCRTARLRGRRRRRCRGCGSDAEPACCSLRPPARLRGCAVQRRDAAGPPRLELLCTSPCGSGRACRCRRGSRRSSG